MRLVQIDHLHGGEVLAREVLTSDYQVLLGEGTVLKPEYIQKLKEFQITSVHIIEEQKKEEHSENTILDEEVRKDCLIKVRDIMQKHVYHQDHKLKAIDKAAEEVILNIFSDEHVVKKVYEIKERSSDLYEHSLSVCSLATLIALRLKITKEKVHEIGTASLLHDLGLMYITFDYNGKDINKLSKKEQEEYKKHTVYGYSAVENEDWISNNVKKMILAHHERLGGTGYPLHEKQLPIPYQILSLCETFDEMLCGVGSMRYKVYEAIEYVKVQKDRAFDRRVVDALLQFAAVYPTGTRVKLSDGTQAIVISQNASFPDRPNVRLIFDQNGNEIKNERIVNMIQTLNLVITEVLD